MLPGTEVLKSAQIEAMFLAEKPPFGVMAHAYQPPRLFNVDVVLDGASYHAGFSVVPEVNDMITNQVYKPILGEVEALPSGLITSIYAPLRSYLKRNKPELFAKIQEAVRNTPDREYNVLGDPLVHIILPFLPSEDQQMLLEAGKQVFINDFGFAPKGLWLPETAVSKEVLHNAALAGYEFVPLRDSQVTHIPPDIRLDSNHNVCTVQTGKEKEIAVLLGNSGLSGFVSYSQESTYNADRFMNERREVEQRYGSNTVMMMDLERYGHHQIGAEGFLKRVLEIQEEYGFSPLNIRHKLDTLKKGGKKTYVDVKDFSSWSCDHMLGRWMGTCCCDNPSQDALQSKQKLYTSLIGMNSFINDSLDQMIPNWRKEFMPIFASLSDDIFTGINFGPVLFDAVLNAGGTIEQAKLYLAKIELMVGMTSCGWFFGGGSSVERTIPSSMVQGIQDLFPGRFE